MKDIIIRELEPQHICDLVNREGKGILQDLIKLLAAPSRYQSFGIDVNWLYPFTQNNGDTIRVYAEGKRGEIVILMSLSGIDFVGKEALFDIMAIDATQRTVVINAIKVFLGWVSEVLGLDKVHCSHHCYDVIVQNINHVSVGGIWEKNGYIRLHLFENFFDRNAQMIAIPEYCIDCVYEPFEKEYVLCKFDREMFHPLSCNPDSKGVISRIIAAANMIVAYNKEVLGFVAFYSNDTVNYIAYITSIVISEKYRGKKIAFRLIKKCKDIAKSRGMKSLQLCVDRHNDNAVHFYRKLGFLEKGVGKEGNILMQMELL